MAVATAPKKASEEKSEEKERKAKEREVAAAEKKARYKEQEAAAEKAVAKKVGVGAMPVTGTSKPMTSGMRPNYISSNSGEKGQKWEKFKNTMGRGWQATKGLSGIGKGTLKLGAAAVSGATSVTWFASGGTLFFFYLIVIGIAIFDYLTSFAMSFSLRFTLGLIVFFYALFLLSGKGESNIEPRRIGILSIFLTVFLAQPFIIQLIGSALPGAERVVTLAFVFLPVWVMFGIFLVQTESAAPRVLRTLYILVAIVIIIGQTGAYASTSLNMNVPKADTAGALDQIKLAVSKGWSSLTGVPSQINTEFQKQQYYATHGYYEGDVAESKKVVHLELLDPAYPNTLNYAGTETNIQLGSYVNAFNLENEMNLAIGCEVLEVCPGEECPGNDVAVNPSKIEGEKTITQDVFCYVEDADLALGANTVRIKATTDFKTKARLNKYFTDKTSFDSQFENYVRKNGITLSSSQDVAGVIKKIYPGAKDADVSLSEDAPVKLIISAAQIPVIGVDDKTQLQVIVAFENNAHGSIKKIKTLTLTYPEGLDPQVNTKLCPAFKKVEGKNIIALNGKESINDLEKLAEGEQRSFSVCTFNVVNPKKLLDVPSNINERSFESEVTYDYTATKDIRITYGKVPLDFGTVSAIANELRSKVTGTPTISASGLAWPTTSTTITSCFGHRTAPTAGASTNHHSIDIGVKEGNPIFAVEIGKVVQTSLRGGYGKSIIIKHEVSSSSGKKVFYSRYNHLSEILVNQGQVVMRGGVIGLSGSTGISTGPHLDFQLYTENKEWANPLCSYQDMKSSFNLAGSNCKDAFAC